MELVVTTCTRNETLKPKKCSDIPSFSCNSTHCASLRQDILAISVKMSMNRAEVRLNISGDLCAGEVTLVKTAVNMSSWLCMSTAPGISS